MKRFNFEINIKNEISKNIYFTMNHNKLMKYLFEYDKLFTRVPNNQIL